MGHTTVSYPCSRKGSLARPGCPPPNPTSFSSPSHEAISFALTERLMGPHPKIGRVPEPSRHSVHNSARHELVARFESAGAHCTLEAAYDSRRIDALCELPKPLEVTVAIETKTIKDLRTPRSRNQLSDMRRTAHERKQALLLQVVEARESYPLNEKAVDLFSKFGEPPPSCNGDYEPISDEFEALIRCATKRAERRKGLVTPLG